MGERRDKSGEVVVTRVDLLDLFKKFKENQIAEVEAILKRNTLIKNKNMTFREVFYDWKKTTAHYYDLGKTDGPKKLMKLLLDNENDRDAARAIVMDSDRDAIHSFVEYNEK